MEKNWSSQEANGEVIWGSNTEPEISSLYFSFTPDLLALGDIRNNYLILHANWYELSTKYYTICLLVALYSTGGSANRFYPGMRRGNVGLLRRAVHRTKYRDLHCWVVFSFLWRGPCNCFRHVWWIFLNLFLRFFCWTGLVTRAVQKCSNSQLLHN